MLTCYLLYYPSQTSRAGHEATANLMTWALVMLMQHPDLWAKCVDDVAQLGDDVINYDNLRNLKVLSYSLVCTVLRYLKPSLACARVCCAQYIEACIDETLRMYPPVPWYRRQAIEDHVLEPFGPEGIQLHVPAGTCVSICSYMLHRDPKYW